MTAPVPHKAVIYCRVSTERQVKEGDGLKSQETRCREYARAKGYNVLRVFSDEGVSGSLPNRPAIRETLAFLATQKESCIVIVDDISRLARGMDAYIELRSLFYAHRAIIESPNPGFGETSHEHFVGNILASVAAYQRDANAEQVKNRMRARLLNGYWTFPAPLGYTYGQGLDGKKLLVVDPDTAPFVRDAFEGFASGRFEHQTDVVRYLETRLPFSRKSCAHPQRVKEMFSRVHYAGYIEYPDWEVSLRQGKHQAIIAMEVYDRVQQRLGRKAKAPNRKDIREDFPLRGFVLCPECRQPMTASWATGRASKHPYYRCKTDSCVLRGKSIRKNEMEGCFEDLLRTLAPSEAVLDLTRMILRESWATKRREFVAGKCGLDQKIKDIDVQIASFMGRLLETKSREMITHYESHVMSLKRQREILAARAREMSEVDTSLEGSVETVFDFIKKPLSLWENGDLYDKRLVLKLAFAQKIAFRRDYGFETAELSLPFKVMRDFLSQKEKMVEATGIEPATFCLQSRRSTN